MAVDHACAKAIRLSASNAVRTRKLFEKVLPQLTWFMRLS